MRLPRSARIPAPAAILSRKRFLPGLILHSAASAALLAVALPLAAQRAPATVQQTGAPAAAASRRRQARDDRRRLRQVALHSRRRDLGRRDVGVVTRYQQRRVDDTLFIENLAAKRRAEAPARVARAILRRLEVGRVLRRRAGARQRRAETRDAGEPDRRDSSCAISRVARPSRGTTWRRSRSRKARSR